jgi:hypothetical protein
MGQTCHSCQCLRQMERQMYSTSASVREHILFQTELCSHRGVVINVPAYVSSRWRARWQRPWVVKRSLCCNVQSPAYIADVAIVSQAGDVG